jgi:hypothetical protein
MRKTRASIKIPYDVALAAVREQFPETLSPDRMAESIRLWDKAIHEAGGHIPGENARDKANYIIDTLRRAFHLRRDVG